MKLTLTLLLLCSLACYVQGQIAWAAGTNGTWGNTASWTGGVVPGAGSDAVIMAPGNYFVTVAASTVLGGDLVLGGMGAVPGLIINSQVIFNITGNLILTTGSVFVQTLGKLYVGGQIIAQQTTSDNVPVIIDFNSLVKTNGISASSTNTQELVFNGTALSEGTLDLTTATVNFTGAALEFGSITTVASTTMFVSTEPITVSGPFNVASSVSMMNQMITDNGAVITVASGSVLNLMGGISSLQNIQSAFSGVVNVWNNVSVMTGGSIRLISGSMFTISNSNLNLMGGLFLATNDSITTGLVLNSTSVYGMNGALVYGSVMAYGNITLSTISVFYGVMQFMQNCFVSLAGNVIIGLNGNIRFNSNSQLNVPNGLTLTANSGGAIWFAGNNMISGTGNLVFLLGAAINMQANSMAMISTPTVHHQNINFAGNNMLEFSATGSILNGTGFVSGGMNNSVVFDGIIDIDTSGLTLSIGSGIAVRFNNIAYFNQGTINLNGDIWIFNTFVTSMNPVSITGTGNLWFASGSSWDLRQPVVSSASLWLNGNIVYQGGSLTLSGMNGTCNGSIALVSGWLSINGGMSIGMGCNFTSNGTVIFNATTMSTNMITAATLGNPTQNWMISGMSQVMSMSGFSLRARWFNMSGNGMLSVAGDTTITSSVNLIQNAMIAVKGVTTVLTVASSSFMQNATIMVDASTAGNAKINSLGVTSLGGKVMLNILGNATVSVIPFLTATYTGTFSSVGYVQAGVLSSYMLGYNTSLVFAYRVPVVTTMAIPVTTSPMTSGSTSGNATVTTSMIVTGGANMTLTTSTPATPTTAVAPVFITTAEMSNAFVNKNSFIVAVSSILLMAIMF